MTSLLSLMLLASCAQPTSASNDAVDVDAGDTAAQDLRGGDDGNAFFIEVEPAPDLVPAATLLAQRFGPYLAGDGFDLTLQPAVEVRGTIDAERLTPPWNAAPLPTERVPVAATLRFIDAQTQDVFETIAGTDGRYAVEVVPSLYELLVTPDQPTVPVRRAPETLYDPTVLDITLDPGAPIWGRVVDREGAPVPNARVSAVDATGAATASATTDDAGWYEVRVQPGVWRTRVQPPPGVRDPVLTSSAFEVGEDGAREDVAWTGPDRASFSLRLENAEGAGVSGVEVRLTSQIVEGYGIASASYTVTAQSNSQGFVDARVPDGIYRIDVQPTSKQRVAPARLTDVLVDGDTDFGTVSLPAFTTLTTTLTDAQSQPVFNATVRCKETTGLGRAWTAVTDELGTATLELASTSVDCIAQPPGSRSDLAADRRTITTFDEAVPITLRAGVVIDGRVRVDTPDGVVPAALSIVRLLDEDFTPIGYGLADESGAFTLRLPTAAE